MEGKLRKGKKINMKENREEMKRERNELEIDE